MAQEQPEPQGVVVSASPPESGDADHAVKINSLRYAFPGAPKPVISNFSLSLPRGSRCILMGENGAGKTTLLQLIAGQYMVGRDAIRVLGRPAFHDTSLVCSGDLSYLGTSWRRDVAFAGYGVALQGDFSAGEMIRGVKDVDPARRDRLITLLRIDEGWRMMRVSDGQRRRVQICMGLLKPYSVLLLDEITVDLDIVGRLDLLEFFEQEGDERGCTIIYATHIFDGIEPWVTHFAYLENGELVKGGEAKDLAAMTNGAKLLKTVEQWLRKARDDRRARNEKSPEQGRVQPMPKATATRFFPNKHMAFYR